MKTQNELQSLQQTRLVGEGDYTEERHAWLKQQSVQEVAAQIQAQIQFPGINSGSADTKPACAG